MILDFLIFHANHEKPISFVDPISGVKQEFDIEACCEYLLKYYGGADKQLVDPEIAAKIKHWWDRKWYVALDYYLCSPTNTQSNSLLTKCTDNDHLYKSDIFLSSVQVEDKLTPMQAILNRKTYREFKQQPISWEVCTSLLRVLDGGFFSDIWQYYLVALNIHNVSQGIYRYHKKLDSLELIKKGAFREQLMESLCGFYSPLTASFTIVLAIDIQKAQKRLPYERALRDIYIDAGRLSQKILVKGMQQHVGGVPIAIRDTLMCKLLDIDMNQIMPIQSLTMGLIPEDI
jgi:hypothetical protein